jgi:uridine kinase
VDPPRAPFLIGIAGPSCSGKSVLAAGVARRLGISESAVIPLDAYYRDLSALRPEERAETNFDHPDALDRRLLSEHLRALARGEPVSRPVYRFDSHTRSGRGCEVPVDSYIVVEGLFALYWSDVRACLGLRVFVDADERLCLDRRLERDTRRRGRTPASVRRQFRETVVPMSRRHVLPTRRYADLVVRGDEPLDRGVAAIVDRVRATGRPGPHLLPLS